MTGQVTRMSEEERWEREDQLAREIMDKVRELAELLRQDYSVVRDPQAIDGFVDELIRDIVKTLRKAGYALPEDPCELFQEEEQ